MLQLATMYRGGSKYEVACVSVMSQSRIASVVVEFRIF